jgi:leucyl/phenylalanyl-tRNA---protein transferase
MVFRLDERLLFPDPALAEPNGLLAIGGDLSVGRLLLAYRHGIFPWYNDETPILWYAPHERFVLFPQELKVSKTMRQVLRSNKFTVTVDRSFKEVIAACAQIGRTGQDGTWITHDMQAAYLELYRRGYAHSVEVWQGGELAGGLYGVQVGKVFCGESMFSKASNASKAALVHLCGMGFSLIDCQVYTAHLASMGARMISREEYIGILRR